MADKRRKLSGPFIAAKIVCCGALLLVATGALSGVGALLFDDGLIWFVAAAAIAVGLFFARRTIGGGARSNAHPHRIETRRSR